MMVLQCHPLILAPTFRHRLAMISSIGRIFSLTVTEFNFIGKDVDLHRLIMAREEVSGTPVQYMVPLYTEGHVEQHEVPVLIWVRREWGYAGTL